MFFIEDAGIVSKMLFYKKDKDVGHQTMLNNRRRSPLRYLSSKFLDKIKGKKKDSSWTKYFKHAGGRLRVKCVETVDKHAVDLSKSFLESRFAHSQLASWCFLRYRHISMANLVSSFSPKFFPNSIGHTSAHFITTAAAFRHQINRRLLLLSSSFFQNTSRLCCFPPALTSLKLSYDTISSKIVSSYFSRGNESSDMMKGSSKSSGRDLFDGKNWTNILIASNVLMFVAQCTTQGRLFNWGAKINGLIDKGQLWRLVTPAFLHADIAHLLVNCFSLHNVGPAIEEFCGPRRFLAVYFTSAIAGCGMSYLLSTANSVGASGAICGLVGSTAVYTLRHMEIIDGSIEDLQEMMRLIAVNVAIGAVFYKRIDNWAHLGGLIGGAATSWLLGPALKHETISGNGQKEWVDRPPILTLTQILKASR